MGNKQTNNEFNDEGFYVLIKPGDVVDTGSGPPSAALSAVSMWVPAGSTINGIPVTSNSDGVDVKIA